ncbi:MAG: metal ABC transporter ATP-binding protein [Cyanobacteriota bacterium]|nr:metal ABC transporter ATP-binding protein [Cyanobacteriota bacterium]
MTPVIDLQDVWVYYDQTPALEAVNFQVQPGDFIGLIGPNGGGKTTLLKVLLGLIKPRRGRVRLLDRPVTQARRWVGYVPQSLEFDRAFPIAVAEVVRMGRLGRRRLFQPYTAQDDAIVARCLEQVKMLDFQDCPLGDLSGGQRQRVYIARALASEPQILLLDEPTANVDSQIQQSVYDLLQELNQTLTIILISHDLAAVSRAVKTVGCLNRRLYYHGDRLLTPEMIEQAYQCPVDLIAHGLPHRVFPEHP